MYVARVLNRRKIEKTLADGLFFCYNRGENENFRENRFVAFFAKERKEVMKMTFRWYGEKDPVTLSAIRQIPAVKGIVSAVYDVPVGEVWKEESVQKLKNSANSNGLEFEVVESVPVHEDIKLGAPGAEKYIDAYIRNIRLLAKYGVKTVCYNFMPVFDWLRSELKKPLADGSNSLAYCDETVQKMNPLTGDLSLPGWDESYTKGELKELLARYNEVDEEKLFANLKAFLEKIIPVCEECDVKMGIHPDDPPWGIFGLPRIITDKAHLERFLKLVDSPYNGVTFCTGSFGADKRNDLKEMIHIAKGKIPFAHIRNVKHGEGRDFQETSHLTEGGSLDIFGVVQTLLDTGFDGYVRPDHGRMIWGETGRSGYGLYDRALGAMYLTGLFEGIEKERKV